MYQSIPLEYFTSKNHTSPSAKTTFGLICKNSTNVSVPEICQVIQESINKFYT